MSSGEYNAIENLVITGLSELKGKSIINKEAQYGLQDETTGKLRVMNGSFAQQTLTNTFPTPLDANLDLTNHPEGLFAKIWTFLPTAGRTITLPTGASIRTAWNNIFTNCQKGDSFTLVIKNYATATNAITIDVTGITGIRSNSADITVAPGSERTLYFIYAGEISGVHEWLVF
jgi:hypothetical protein